MGRRAVVRKRLLMEDFYREARLRHGVLLEGGEPAGGRWNYDHENREPPPKGADTLGVPEPIWPEEDEIDDEVRADLDRWERDGEVSFIGQDGPRLFPATREEALAGLDAVRQPSGWPASVPTRTRCSRETRGWRTRWSRRR